MRGLIHLNLIKFSSLTGTVHRKSSRPLHSLHRPFAVRVRRRQRHRHQHLPAVLAGQHRPLHLRLPHWKGEHGAQVADPVVVFSTTVIETVLLSYWAFEAGALLEPGQGYLAPTRNFRLYDRLVIKTGFYYKRAFLHLKYSCWSVCYISRAKNNHELVPRLWVDMFWRWIWVGYLFQPPDSNPRPSEFCVSLADFLSIQWCLTYHVFKHLALTL